jgi:hypothetical protein
VRRRLWLVLPAVIAASLAAASLAPADGPAGASAPSPGYRTGDYADGRAMSILPPGENGLVNAADALKFETLGRRPANSQDQLGKYADLLYGYPKLTDATLGSYFDDESFGVRAGDVQRVEKPRPGVTIYRDRHDVPHVYAGDDAALAFGAGYAQAEDRLFLMDVLRHYGEGTLASFLGASCEFEQMDHDQLLLAPYTKQAAIAQVDALPREYGRQGTLARRMIYDYVAGVNEYVSEASGDPNELPADYAAAVPSPLPEKWSVADVVAIAGLIGGIFGRGGGSEIANAHLLEYLQNELGDSAGLRAFHQVRTGNDPLAPTTASKPFPYEIPGRVDPATTALPDAGAAITGGPTNTLPGCDLTKPNEVALGIVDALTAMPKH